MEDDKIIKALKYIDRYGENDSIQANGVIYGLCVPPVEVEKILVKNFKLKGYFSHNSTLGGPQPVRLIIFNDKISSINPDATNLLEVINTIDAPISPKNYHYSNRTNIYYDKTFVLDSINQGQYVNIELENINLFSKFLNPPSAAASVRESLKMCLIGSASGTTVPTFTYYYRSSYIDRSSTDDSITTTTLNTDNFTISSTSRISNLNAATCGTADLSYITNGLKSTTTTVDVYGATAPSSGQVLTASNSTTASWVTPSTTASLAYYSNGLVSATTNIDVYGAIAPSSGQVLTASNSTTASWVTPSTTANLSYVTNGLKSATTTVDVYGATAPSSGQVLTASNSTTASWVTPDTWQDGADAVSKVRVGSAAVAASSGQIALLGSSTGTNAIAIGPSSVSSYSNNIAIGSSASATIGTNGIAIGTGAVILDNSGIAIGNGAKATNVCDISIGNTAGNTNGSNTGVISLAGIPDPSTTSYTSTHKIPITINGTVYYLLAHN